MINLIKCLLIQYVNVLSSELFLEPRTLRLRSNSLLSDLNFPHVWQNLLVGRR